MYVSSKIHLNTINRNTTEQSKNVTKPTRKRRKYYINKKSRKKQAGGNGDLKLSPVDKTDYSTQSTVPKFESPLEQYNIDTALIHSFFKPIQCYLQFPVAIIFDHINIEKTIAFGNCPKKINVLSKCMLSRTELMDQSDSNKNSKQFTNLLEILNTNLNKRTLKHRFNLDIPLNDANADILLNFMYRAIQYRKKEKKKTDNKKFREYVVRLSREKKSVQKLLHTFDTENKFEYLSEQQRQEFVLMIKNKMEKCRHGYDSIYNILKLFFKSDRVPFKGRFINSKNHKKQIFEICKSEVSSTVIKRKGEKLTFNIPIEDFE